MQVKFSSASSHSLVQSFCQLLFENTFIVPTEGFFPVSKRRANSLNIKKELINKDNNKQRKLLQHR